MSRFDHHDLGKVEHVFLRRKLRLETRGLIRISSPLLNVFPFSSIFQQLETIISSDIWVTRGNGLRIGISVLLDVFMHPTFDRKIFLEGLGIFICNAEVL